VAQSAGQCDPFTAPVAPIETSGSTDDQRAPQEPRVSPRYLDPEGPAPMDAAQDDGCDDPDNDGVKPAEEFTPVGLRRMRTIRLGSELERGVWMWLIVIGAIVLMVLMAIAVSQVRSNLPKGRDGATIERVEPGLSATRAEAWPRGSPMTVYHRVVVERLGSSSPLLDPR